MGRKALNTRRQATLDFENRLAIRSAYRMKALDKIFSQRGPAAQPLLLPYLDHPNEGVRYWTAMWLWPVVPVKARAVMEQIARIFADRDGRARVIAGDR